MQLSLVGTLICIMLILASRWSGGLLAVLIGSLAFGATAAVSLPSLGGSSPLIFTMLQIFLICSVVLKRSFIHDLWSVMSQQPIAWVVLIFMIYTIGGSVILPRLFFGQTTAFVPIKTELRIAEVPLSPVSGNVTQTLYFVLNVLTFFAVAILFSKENHAKAVRNGFFIWATLLVSTGFMDLIGKLIGAEKKRISRAAQQVPIYDVQVGEDEGQIPVDKLQRHLMKLPRNLTKGQVAELNDRLQALPRSMQMPKGPIPRGAKMPKGPKPKMR